MKKILFLLMAMVPVICFGQIFIPDGKYGTQHIRSQKDSVDIIPKGLTGSNNGKRTNIFGKDTAQIRYNVGDSSIYYHTGSQWLKLTGGIGGGGGGIDSVTFSPSQNVDTVKYWIAGTGYVAGVVDVKCGLIEPGTVVHDSLLAFTVSPSIHRSCEDGIRYTTALTHFNLNTADATFGRYDIVALEGNDVVVVEGTASATPLLPQLTSAQTMLTFISVPALATVPSGPFTTIIYDEADVSEFTGSTVNVTASFTNTTSPYHFVTAISAGAVTSTSSITYTGSDFNISKYHTLRFFIKLKAAFAQNTRFQLSWLRDGVTQSGTVTMQNNTYGYLRSSSVYQEIIIPISDFGPFLTDSVDAIKIQLTGSNASGFYLDYIQIQGGIDQAPTVTTRDRFAVSGEDAVATQNRYFNAKNHYLDLDSVSSFVIGATNTRFRHTSILGNSWLEYLPFTTGITINPLSTGIPLNFLNIPLSDTATYVMGVTASGRSVLQLKSSISGSTPTLLQVTTAGAITNVASEFNGGLISNNQNIASINSGTSRTAGLFNGDFAAVNSGGFQVTLRPDLLTANRTQYFPDYDGVIGVHPTISGQAGKVLAVNGGETALEWIAGGARPYKVYTAQISQTGTSAPTVTVLENTLGVTPTYGRTGAGDYTFNVTGGLLVANKTAVFFNGFLTGNLGGAGFAFTIISSVNSINIQTLNNSFSNTDDFLDGTRNTIEVRVYN